MNLKRLREERGITQTELAKQLGVVRSTICFYESEQHSPTPEMLIRLADFFGVTVDYLLERECGTVSASVAPMGETLTASERELLAGFRQLSPGMQEVVLTTVRGLTGAGGSTLQKKA